MVKQAILTVTPRFSRAGWSRTTSSAMYGPACTTPALLATIAKTAENRPTVAAPAAGFAIAATGPYDT